MRKKNIFNLFIISLLTITTHAQNISSIWEGINSIGLGGSPSSISINNEAAIPIAFTDPCLATTGNFVVATAYESGRVVVVGHGGFIGDGNIDSYDNLQYTSNIMDWIGAGKKKISFKPGITNLSNTKIVQENLFNDGYEIISAGAGDITSTTLENTDILIIGNDWNNQLPYGESELRAIDNFVANGGGLLVLGLGWSWPGELADYPMNQVAGIFGVNYTKTAIPVKEFTNFDFYADDSSLFCYPKYVGTNYARGESLRVLRMAVSVAGEITSEYDSVDEVKVKIEQWIEGLNQVYGREYAIRFELIPNNDVLIFSDADTDPWPPVLEGNGCQIVTDILNVQKENISAIIGEENYDISHIIADVGGGCAGSFTKGVTGDFSIVVGRHEVGHQFGQPHTVNYANNPINYEHEKGGGWTIHGGNKNDYAHATTYHTTVENISNRNLDKGTKVPTGNTVPLVDAGSDYTIPISTPFLLTANASDPDDGDVLTYVWDNMSPWYMQTIPADDDTQGVLFARFLPTTSNQRTFPRMSDVVDNINIGEYEQLPANPRAIDLRLTVNDNHQMNYNGKVINASGINSDDLRITVADAGPFVVTSQRQEGIAYYSGSPQEVTWQVNGTDKAPIHTTEVKISLSLDGGYTYPIVLKENTANDGREAVVMPYMSVDNARIKVEAVGNIFFDINTNDFKIVHDCATVAYNDTQTLQAESYCEMLGIEKENLTPTNQNIGYVENGDYIRFSNVRFAEGTVRNVRVRASSATSGGTIDIHKDSRDNEPIGSIEVSATGGWRNYEIFEGNLENLGDVTDLYFVFRGDNGYLFNIDLFDFSEDFTLRTTMVSDLDVNSNISIFPIPAKDELFIQNPSNIHLSTIRLYSISGRLFKEIYPENNNDIQKLTISGLGNGMYFMTIHHKYGITSKELLIHR